MGKYFTIPISTKRELRAKARQKVIDTVAALTQAPQPYSINELIVSERAIYQQELLDILKRLKKQYKDAGP